MHYTIESVIALSKCTTLKHAVPGKGVINILFLVTVTFNLLCGLCTVFNASDRLKVT